MQDPLRHAAHFERATAYYRAEAADLTAEGDHGGAAT
jgi:hypothetical protein